MKERISVTEYSQKDGWVRKEYTIGSKNGVFDKGSSSSSSGGGHGSTGSSSGGYLPGTKAIAASLMVLATLVVIVIIWVVAINSRSNLYFLAVLLTFGILGWDAFVIFISANDFAYLLGEKDKRKRAKRKRRENDHLNSLGRCEYYDHDII